MGRHTYMAPSSSHIPQRLQGSGGYLPPTSPLRTYRHRHPYAKTPTLVKVALAHVFLPILQFPLSVLFYQCSVIIFVYMLPCPEEQTNIQRN